MPSHFGAKLTTILSTQEMLFGGAGNSSLGLPDSRSNEVLLGIAGIDNRAQRQGECPLQRGVDKALKRAGACGSSDHEYQSASCQKVGRLQTMHPVRALPDLLQAPQAGSTFPPGLLE